jgi:predicted nucleic acid-binding protein
VKVYFDACALNRLTDDHDQSRIYDEAKAVERFLGLIASGRAELVASTALRLELSRNRNLSKRSDSLKLLSYAGALFHPDGSTLARATHFERLGYGAFDALHLACAEQTRADILLTTDDRFCKLSLRRVGNATVEALNPLNWFGKGGLP